MRTITCKKCGAKVSNQYSHCTRCQAQLNVKDLKEKLGASQSTRLPLTPLTSKGILLFLAELILLALCLVILWKAGSIESQPLTQAEYSFLDSALNAVGVIVILALIYRKFMRKPKKSRK